VLILSRRISKFTALSSCFPVWSHIAENQLVTITCHFPQVFFETLPDRIAVPGYFWLFRFKHTQPGKGSKPY